MDNDKVILELVKANRLRVDFVGGYVYATKSNMPDEPIGAKTKKGYLRTCVHYKGRRFFLMVHRIVWVAAYGVPSGKVQVDHINNDKLDNRIINLEGVSNAENMRRAAVDGLTRGGWRNAPRDNKGRFLTTARLLNEFPPEIAAIIEGNK